MLISRFSSDLSIYRIENFIIIENNNSINSGILYGEFFRTNCIKNNYDPITSIKHIKNG